MKSLSSCSASSSYAPFAGALQLACLAATPVAVRAAIDAGADWVRIPYRFRHPIGCNSRNNRLSQAIRYAHGRARKVVLDLGVSPPALSWEERRAAFDWAEDQGFDAIVLSEIAPALYCAARHPNLRVHFLAPATLRARTAMLLRLQLNAARILVPHSISPSQLTEISTATDVALEVLGFGCPLQEKHITSSERDSDADGMASNDEIYSAERHLAATLRQLPLLASLRIRAIQVEARNDTPDEVGNVARIWRTAIDRCLEDGVHFAVDPSWQTQLNARRERT